MANSTVAEVRLVYLREIAQLRKRLVVKDEEIARLRLGYKEVSELQDLNEASAQALDKLAGIQNR